MAGTTCPQCRQHAHLRRDGTLGEHRTDLYLPFSNRRERCRYSGVTPDEAEVGITALIKQTVAHHTTGQATAEQKTRFATDPKWQRWMQLVTERAAP